MTNSLVIFDCDGVLVDSEIISCQIASAEFGRHGFPITYEDYVTAFAGKNRAEVMVHVEKTAGIKLPSEFSDLLEKRILAGFTEKLKPIDDIGLAIEASPVRCIASGSSRNRVNHSLKVTGLDSYFLPDHIFSSTMVAHGKPAPDLFLLAAREMGYRPERCIVIEDSISGVKAAKAAGMTCLGFTGGGHILSAKHGEQLLAFGAEAVFPKMAPLSRYLRQILTL